MDSLGQEEKLHAQYALDIASGCWRRENALERISSYLQHGPARPLVVVGESGVGESRLMAAAVEQARERHPETTIIARFLGLTPRSTQVVPLLDGLLREIESTRYYEGYEPYLDIDYHQKCLKLEEHLECTGHSIHIFVDALDQLEEQLTHWTPRNFHPNGLVRMVISTTPGVWANAAEARFGPGSVVRLEPMAVVDGEALLDEWLERWGRQLQPAQREHLLAQFAVTGLPLYLRLAAEEASRWRADDSLEQYRLPEGLAMLITRRFRRLQQERGEMLVNRALAYLAAALDGLSRAEMLAVLERDDAVLGEFDSQKHHQLPAGRLPQVLWSRLFGDLEPYLTERRSDHTTVLAFYHRAILEVARVQFLMPKANMIHRRLADYFKYGSCARWQGTGMAPHPLW
ncbi:MAG TPA: hypothetical protein VD902_18275 [Symbiobacteriaceae bacterium]|nr:hypothetical protein [Symbiobacteriaceae bacterium]